MIPWILLAVAPLAFGWLWFVSAPYGRHADARFGPTINGRIGWVAMEWPTLVLFTLCAWPLQGSAWLAAALWWLHYGRRTLVFPFVASSVRPMALVVVAMGMSFQLLNSPANGWALQQPRAWTDPLLWAGAVLFVAGQVVNHHGDDVLRRLRKPGDTGYHLPREGLYRWVTNVAYLGELISWFGWWVLTGSLAGFAFFVFTAANLVPRAWSNAVWYRERFGRMPGRWVLVPWVW